MWSGFATSKAAAATSGGAFKRRQAAPRFLGFFCARLSCRAAPMSMTLLRAGFTRGAWRFWPLGLVIDQLFHVVSATVMTFRGIEVRRYAVDQLHGEIDLMRAAFHLTGRRSSSIGRISAANRRVLIAQGCERGIESTTFAYINSTKPGTALLFLSECLPRFISGEKTFSPSSLGAVSPSCFA
jgi:hypothetical protein